MKTITQLTKEIARCHIKLNEVEGCIELAAMCSDQEGTRELLTHLTGRYFNHLRRLDSLEKELEILDEGIIDPN